jgi:3'(2'), 5'-bisphosphate nucleotidase
VQSRDAERHAIQVRKAPHRLAVVASKSHFTQNTADYLASLERDIDQVSVGSSLKFCILAEGKADLYPRLSPTSEWDTAAGHAVLLAAGGRVDAPEGGALRYGKAAFLNRGFLALGDVSAPRLEPFMAEFAGGGDLPQGV